MVGRRVSQVPQRSDCSGLGGEMDQYSPSCRAGGGDHWEEGIEAGGKHSVEHRTSRMYQRSRSLQRHDPKTKYGGA